jgi:hypothetical protein
MVILFGAVFHISNRCVDLEPVMRGAADHLALHAALSGTPDVAWGSVWVAMSSRPERIDALKARGWRELSERSILWTDQRSNLLSVLG